ncbi:hypothetical protein BDW22DRAFT_133857 [Trametopsis cervina]|nr:hypothetical protein BDW22DRAFT_133857 [Trametopsis cervina]
MAQQYDVVSGDQYRYALTNFRIAHEKVEEQRGQLQEQEKQVALLRERIALLEGTSDPLFSHNKIAGSVDDFSIKNAASQLEREINSWAASVIANPPADLGHIRHAALTDILDGEPPQDYPVPESITGFQMQTLNLLRHALAKTICDGIVNCLIVTDSPDANIQLTRIHEHIFARDATVASVWRRQTFSAAVETCSRDMSRFFISEHLPSLALTIRPDENDNAPAAGIYRVLEGGYEFSRMLHGAPSSAGGSVDAFYRAFVPELGSILHPSQIELVKRCMTSERREQDRIGATVFPGLVKVTRGPAGPSGQQGPHAQTVVRRAQAICECALGIYPKVMGEPTPHMH